MDLAEGAELASHSAGPHEISDAANELYESIIPPSPDLDYLAGRIALSLEETKLALGIGDRTLKLAIERGEIPTVKVGGRRLVPRRGLERHLEALAYAGSGALDLWQSALAKGAAVRVANARKQAVQRRKYLRRKLRLAHQKGVTGASEDHRLLLLAELQELDNQNAIGEQVAKDLRRELDL